MKQRPWKIHLTANGVPCSCCGKVEYPYIDGICDAHTEGLYKLYRHPEFQMILDYPTKQIGYILNTLADAVQRGERFTPRFIAGIFEDCLIQLAPIQLDDTPAFRVIIPDRHNIWPNDPKCEYPYNKQLLHLDQLQRSR